MRSKFLLLVILLIGFNFKLKADSFFIVENDSAFYFSAASELEPDQYIKEQPTVQQTDQIAHFQHSKLAMKYKAAFQENRRLTAAMLTFALGMLGVHRLYLGTEPWIPAVYLLTFGGGFLILPLIDLGVILFCKDISKYEHNDKVLMWVK